MLMGPGPCVTWVENHNCRSIVEAIGKDVHCLRTDFGAQALKRWMVEGETVSRCNNGEIVEKDYLVNEVSVEPLRGRVQCPAIPCAAQTPRIKGKKWSHRDFVLLWFDSKSWGVNEEMEGGSEWRLLFESACFVLEDSCVLLHYWMPALCPSGLLDPGSVKL